MRGRLLIALLLTMQCAVGSVVQAQPPASPPAQPPTTPPAQPTLPPPAGPAGPAATAQGGQPEETARPTPPAGKLDIRVTQLEMGDYPTVRAFVTVTDENGALVRTLTEPDF